MTMTQPWPAPLPARARTWPIATLAGLAAILAVAALIVAFSRSGSTPTYTAAQKAEAKTNLCDQYKLAAQAMHIETSKSTDPALARIALTNGALILETASANPALEAKYSIAARALAMAYQTQTAMGTTAPAEQYKRTGEDLNAKDHVMQGLCGD